MPCFSLLRFDYSPSLMIPENCILLNVWMTISCSYKQLCITHYNPNTTHMKDLYNGEHLAKNMWIALLWIGIKVVLFLWFLSNHVSSFWFPHPVSVNFLHAIWKLIPGYIASIILVCQMDYYFSVQYNSLPETQVSVRQKKVWTGQENHTILTAEWRNWKAVATCGGLQQL